MQRGERGGDEEPTWRFGSNWNRPEGGEQRRGVYLMRRRRKGSGKSLEGGKKEDFSFLEREKCGNSPTGVERMGIRFSGQEGSL